MEKRLFVGNLPFSMTGDDLRSLFSEFGEIVSAEVVINRMSNRSKGFGFVEFATNQEAQSAIDKLHETEQGGRKIIVAFAKPRPEESQSANNNSGASNLPASDETNYEPAAPVVPEEVVADTAASNEESVVNAQSAIDLDTDPDVQHEDAPADDNQTTQES